jgi:hypothetical protein
MKCEQLRWKGHGGGLPWPFWCIRPTEIYENLSHDSQCSGRDSNQAPPEHTSDRLLLGLDGRQLLTGNSTPAETSNSDPKYYSRIYNISKQNAFTFLTWCLATAVTDELNHYWRKPYRTSYMCPGHIMQDSSYIDSSMIPVKLCINTGCEETWK